MSKEIRSESQKQPSQLLRVQPKLEIGQPGDKYEREADAVSDRVMKSNPEQPAMQATSGTNSIQMKCNECETKSPIQMKPVSGPGARMTAGSSRLSSSGGTIQTKRNGSLPKDLQAKMESSLGQDFSNVSIQKNSHKAAELNARAFTMGDSVHFAPGEFNTSSEQGKNLIGHEFTHVAQQRSGVVSPTRVMGKGLNLNDDRGLESEADNFGQRAVRGETISKYRSTSLGIRSALRPAIQTKSNVLQMAKHPSHYGNWYDDTYKLTSSGTRRGADMSMRFEPNNNVDAKMIGLVQTVRKRHKGKPFYSNSDPFYEGRAIDSKEAKSAPTTSGTDEGTHIDQFKAETNPLYAVTGSTHKDKTLLDTPAKAKWGQHGYHYTNTSGLQHQDAKLEDTPSIGSVDMSKNSYQVFETTALALKGNQKDTYYGSIQWGWQTNSAGKHSKIPFKVIHEGAPSSTFFKSAEKWNSSKTSKGHDTLDLPVHDVQVVSNLAGVDIGLGPVFTHLPVGTRVVELPVFVSMVEKRVRVVSGAHIGEIGNVHVSDLADERN